MGWDGMWHDSVVCLDSLAESSYLSLHVPCQCYPLRKHDSFGSFRHQVSESEPTEVHVHMVILAAAQVSCPCHCVVLWCFLPLNQAATSFSFDLYVSTEYLSLRMQGLPKWAAWY